MLKSKFILIRFFPAIFMLLIGSCTVIVDCKINNTGKKGSSQSGSTATSVPSNPIIVGSFDADHSGHAMTQPCLMYEAHIGSRKSWWCELFGEDAKNAGAGDGHSASVRIVGLTKSSPGSNWISGSTTLFSKGASIHEKKYLFIPETASVKFGTKDENGVHSFLNTVDTIKKTIVVRVKATQSESTPSIDQLRSDIFGDEDDEYNFKTQMEGCSFNRVKIEKATGPNINDGVVEVNVETTDDEVLDYEMMETKVRDALETLFDTNDLSTAADLIMICQPPATVFDGFSAYAYYNSPLSFYWDYYCTYPDLDMHEVGHNLYLAHSSQLGSEYGDGSGVMGGSVFADEGDNTLRCYNSAKMWQLRWFEENSHDLDLLNTDWEGTLVGTSNFQVSNIDDEEKNVILKIADSYYVQFNYAAGFNYGSREFINRVTITRQYDDGELSWIQAALREGEAYTIDIFGFGPITVEVIKIDTGSFESAYAYIHVYQGSREKCVEDCCFDINCGNDSRISTDRSIYNPGDTIEVSFANNSPKKYDWIWILEGADVDRFGQSSKEWNDEELWLFICGSDDCEETPTSGVLSFDSSNLREGIYRAYYLWIDRYDVAVASAEFTVVGNGNTLPPTIAPTPSSQDNISSDKSIYSTDSDIIKITFYDSNPTQYDWIGIYSADEVVEEYGKISNNDLAWIYACGSKQCAEEGNVIYDGTVSFSTEDLEIGVYRAYLLFGDQYSVITRSEEFIVKSVAPSSSPVAPTAPASAPFFSPVIEPDEWEEIFAEGFEDGSSDYFKGMGKRLVNNSNKSNNGEYSARIKKTQKFVSKNQLIGEFTELKINFFYYAENMDQDESFSLQYKLKGSQWTEAGVWRKGEAFENSEWNEGTVSFPTDGKNKVTFRFVGQANRGNERIYFDDITFSGK